MSRRLKLYLAACFAITWTAWGLLILLTSDPAISYGTPLFMSLFIVGGFGPTIAAFISVLATAKQQPAVEFYCRLFRWRVSGRWYLVALCLPVGLAITAMAIAALLQTAPGSGADLRPWYMFFPLFGMMIIGGGLEELGWRGIGQAELQGANGAWKAALIVGILWAIWHLPLFFIPGTSQFGGDIGLFAAGVIGHALLLGWLYHRTESILLCVLFHASANSAAALGLSIPDNTGWLALTAPLLDILLGTALLLWRNPSPSSVRT